ncbi:MAG: hypothetical protein KKF48_02345 [Nanoarchaeota archaeon]|nr:hypothetical protein [Nanoarchaeota archaeon]
MGNIKPVREVVHNLTEEELLKEKGVNEALKRENLNLRKAKATLESQVVNKKAEDFEKKEKVNQNETNNQIAKKLKEEEKELNEDKYGKWFSWNKLFKKYFSNKKFREKFEVSDKNIEVSWKFGELMSSTKGFWGITDSNGKLLIVSQDLKGLIHKPESLFNQFKLSRLILSRDKDGDYIQGIDDQGDLDDFETEVPSFNEETGEYEKTTSLKLNAREYIIQLQDKLREKDDRNKILEFSMNGLRTDNSMLKRNVDTLLHAGKLGQSMTSEAQSLLCSSSMELSNITKKISALQEKSVIDEKTMAVKDSTISKLLDELENTGDQTAYKRALAHQKEMREFERANPPQIIEKEKEKVPQKINNTPQQLPG